VDGYLKLLLDPSLSKEEQNSLRQQIITADIETYQLQKQIKSLQKLKDKKRIIEKFQRQEGITLTTTLLCPTISQSAHFALSLTSQR